jgi:uncharacterized protein (TIGR00369 family)
MSSEIKFKDFSNVPANRFLGLELISHSNELVILSMKVKPEYLQEYGVVHGAILTAIADTSAVYLFHPHLADDQKITSIEFKVNFIAPALNNGKPVQACAKVVKKGRKIGLADVEVFQEEKLILKGLFTYLFFKAE